MSTTVEKKLLDILSKELDLSEDKIEVISFGYRLFIYSILGYLAIAVVSYFLGTLAATLTAAITASIFRIFSGGAHASSQKRCVIIGAVIFNLIGIVVTFYYNRITLEWMNWFCWITFIVAIITFILYAPADTPGKPITTKIQRSRLKKISIGLLILWLILINFVFKGETNIYKLHLLASTSGLAWQSVNLWPSTYKWVIFK